MFRTRDIFVISLLIVVAVLHSYGLGLDISQADRPLLPLLVLVT